MEYFIEFKYYYQKGLNMERSKDTKKQIDSKDLKNKEDSSSDSDSFNRSIDYNDINDNYPNALDL